MSQCLGQERERGRLLANPESLMHKVKLEKSGPGFRGEAVGNGEPWKVGEQGSGRTQIL